MKVVSFSQRLCYFIILYAQLFCPKSFSKNQMIALLTTFNFLEINPWPSSVDATVKGVSAEAKLCQKVD